MAEQMASERAGRRPGSRRWIALASSREPEPAEAKWPRRWRYALVLGAPLLFWAGLFAAIHWG
jgi:hypothetical protein